MILTANEKNILRFLATRCGEEHSINEIGKLCEISPSGAHKVLLKLKKEGVLKTRNIANIKVYDLDFDGETTRSVLELAFLPEPVKGRVLFRANDVQPLRSVTKACLLFGSYSTSKRNPEDMDILCIIEKKKFTTVKNVLEEVKKKTPLPVHEVLQTMNDIQKNITGKDPVVVDALQKGIVLWGAREIVEVIQTCHQKK